MKRNLTGTFLAVFMTIVLLADPVAAGPVAEEPPDVEITFSAVRIDTGFVGPQVLRVGGPGSLFWQQRFEAHKTPVIKPVDDKGQPFPDGIYTWEIWPIFDDTELAAAKKAAGATASGYLTLTEGHFQVPEPPDVLATKVTHHSDTSIEGSLCVGREYNGTSECDSNVTFNEPLLMYDRELRLTFRDSSTGGAPNNEWQIVVNDDDLGSAERFSIKDVDGNTTPFTIEAGATDDSLYIEDGGSVGIGTSTPRFDLEVSGGTTTSANFIVSGISAAMEFEDVNAPTNEKVVQFLSNGGVWRVRGLNDALTLETTVGLALELGSGDFGVGVSNPSYPLEVGTDSTDGNGAHVTAGGVWTNGSSRASKKDIRHLDAIEALTTLTELEPVTYRYKGEPEEEYVGFIAEDVPDLVASSSRRHLSPMDIVAVLTRVVQEQQRTIAAQQQSLRELGGRVHELEADQ